MASDRTKDLKQAAQFASLDEEEPAEGGTEMTTMNGGGGGEADAEEFLNDFYEAVSEIKSMLTEFKRNIEALDRKQNEILAAASGTQKAKHTKELDELLANTRANVQRIKKSLEDMEGNAKWKANDSTASSRIIKNIKGTLTMKFTDMMKEFQEKQRIFSNNLKDRYKRHIKIVKPEATDDQIEEYIDKGKGESIFGDQLVNDPKHSEAVLKLTEIREQAEDLKKLEQSIIELHNLFLDMHTLVFAQGEMIDQIEANVMTASAYVEAGVTETFIALQHARDRRKKICCIVIITIVILGLVAVPISLWLADQF